MSRRDQFKLLNVKVSAGAASAEERAQWLEDKQTFLVVQESPDGGRQFQRALIRVAVGVHHAAGSAEAFTSDLGAGGIGLQLDLVPAVGTEVTLRLSLPGEGEPIKVRARVAWTGEDRLVGFEFVDLPAALRDRIDALVWEQVEVPNLPAAPAELLGDDD